MSCGLVAETSIPLDPADSQRPGMAPGVDVTDSAVTSQLPAFSLESWPALSPSCAGRTWMGAASESWQSQDRHTQPRRHGTAVANLSFLIYCIEILTIPGPRVYVRNKSEFKGWGYSSSSSMNKATGSILSTGCAEGLQKSQNVRAEGRNTKSSKSPLAPQQL